MRIRQVKPGLWSNKKLASLGPHTRLLFIGLWNMADREGRLKDIISTIHYTIFPFEVQLDVNAMLLQLHRSRFIKRYSIAGEDFIQIVNFTKHQSCHVKEAPSVIPPPKRRKARCSAPGSAPCTAPCTAPEKHGQSPPSSSSTSTSTSTSSSSSRPRAGKEVSQKKRKEVAFADVPSDVVERLRIESKSQEEFTAAVLREYRKRHPEGQGGG